MALLELECVVKRYRRGSEQVSAIDGASLELGAGEMLALHGPSGSGKTTLLLLVAALLSPDEGEIRFDGRPISALSEREACDYLQRDVGFVYQSPQLMGRVSALENVALKLVLAGTPRARLASWHCRGYGASASPHRPADAGDALRRRAAARRDRARACGGATPDPRRRADRQPR